MGIVTAIGCQGINELDRADEERLRCWTKSISHQNTITQSTGQPLQDPARLLCLFCILSYSKHIIFFMKRSHFLVIGDFYVIFGDFLVGTGDPPPYCDKIPTFMGSSKAN